MFSPLRCLGLFLSFASTTFPLVAQNHGSDPGAPNINTAAMKLARLPIAFEPKPDAGIDDAYIARSGGMLAEFGPTEMRLSMPLKDKSSAITLRLIEGNRKAHGTPSEKLEGESNYLLGNDPAHWRVHVQQFGRITYDGVYAGVDLTYYGNGSQLEHDFVVHPGASTDKIRLQLDGAEALHLTPDGELEAGLDNGTVVLRKPVAYQEIEGKRKEVPVSFQLAGKVLSFHVGKYDATAPLVIDPVLDYSTFLGDASIYVYKAAVDANYNTYITGLAPAAFGATSGTATCSSCTTGTRLALFVMKLNSTGSGVSYSTFLGGSKNPYNNASQEQPTGIAVDTNGNAILTGFTSSTDFPMKNAIATSGVPSFSDGFLTSLSADGSSLNYSSRLGGSSSGSSSADTSPGALALDASGNVYVAGTTQSPYLQTTTGALHGATPGYGTTTGFVMKFTPAGALTFGAIVGATGSASGGVGINAMAVDSTGVIYLAGTAGAVSFALPTTTPWPTTTGAYQTGLLGNAQNAPFITRISSDGSTILSSTLVGAGIAYAMALTSTNDVLLTGLAGYDFPVTPDAYNGNAPKSPGGSTTTYGITGFYAKVSSDGSQLRYSSMFGSTGSTVTIRGIGEDSDHNVWLAGSTVGTLTELVHPLQSVYTYPSGAGFVAKFDTTLHGLLFASYVGSGYTGSAITGFAIDGRGHAHVAGTAGGTDFPTTTGAYLRTVTPPPANYYYNYGFAAEIDASTAGPSVCFAKQIVPVVRLGKTGTGSFDIVNCGDGPLNVSAIQLTSDVFSLDSPTHCTTSIAAGQSCTVSYTFTPKVMGSVSATVALTSDAPMATKLTISARGTAPVVFLPGGTGFAFQPQVIGGSQAKGAILIGNKGTASLNVDTTRTTITGPFTITATTCGTAISPSAGCTYQFTFNPTAAGSFTGKLTIYEDDPATPSVTITLTGSALDTFPTPSIKSLGVSAISLDGKPVSLGIFGQNFFQDSTVLVNGITVPVNSYTNTILYVTVDPAILGRMGEFPVQVVNPGAGGGSNLASLASYHVISQPASASIYDPISKLMYLAIPSTAAKNANTILPVNPATGELGTPIPVLTNPARLAVSDDGHYLYVGFYYLYGMNPPAGSLQRIDLQTKAVDKTFTLPGGSNGIIDMHVVPGSPQNIVVALTRPASPSENGIALFNDGGLVQYVANDYPRNATLDNFTFTSDPSTYYGYPLSNGFFGTGTVTSTGITPVVNSGICCDQASGSIVVSDGTLLYTNSGQVWDPKQKKLLGQYDSSLFYEPSVVADATAKRTFILSTSYATDNGYNYPAILSYDPSTMKSAGVLSFNESNSPLSLSRWGNDGFAFLNGPYTSGDFTTPGFSAGLLLIRSRLAAGSTAGNTVTATSLQPSSAGAGSAALTLTVNGTGFTSASTVLWNGIVRTTTWVSSTQLTASIPSTDLVKAGTASVVVSTDGVLTSGLSFSIVGANLTLTPASLSFAAQTTGTQSAAQTITVQNTGLADATNLNVNLTGTDAASFSQSSTCGSALAAGASCTINVIFAPAADGTKQATVAVTSSIPGGTQSVSLSGTGAVPTLSLSNQSISFGQVAAGNTGQMNVTVLNSGVVPLSNIAGSIAGANASEFKISGSTCGATLTASASCTMTLVFTPSGTGDRTASLTVSASGAVSQSVNLSGTGTAPDFVLPPPSGSSTTTVQAGQPASFTFNIGQLGSFTGTVTMSCSNLPAYASCTFSPASFTVGSTPTAVTLNIATQQTVTASLKEAPEMTDRYGRFAPIVLCLMIPVLSHRVRRRLHTMRLAGLLGLMLMASAMLSGCSGSSSSKTPTQSVMKTAAGTYTVTVTAASGTVSHSTAITLVVQ